MGKEQDKGASASQTGLSPTVEPVPVSPPDGASIPSAEDELASKSPEQIGNMLNALSVAIEHYRKSVASFEERYAKEREFLLSLMAEFVRLTHFVARRAADSLEQTASRIEARSDETPTAAQPEGQEPDPQGDAHV